MSRTKIVCTIGPASKSLKVLRELIRNGMNMARLNFSHGDHADHLKLLNNIREAAKLEKQTVAILQDLQGPRIRIGSIEKKGRMLKNGDKVVMTTSSVPATSKKLPITYDKLHLEIKKGHRILIVDGLIELSVLNVKGKDIETEVVIGGLVETHKGVNLPDTDVRIPPLTEKDKTDALWGMKNKVDYMALSFVRCAKDVEDLRKIIVKNSLKDEVVQVKIIVKIERKEAIDNINEIIDATDAVMVARGDLGIELPPEDIPLLQKMMIERCMEKAKPVIVATQMLESMIKNPRPTRAEISDVANAVIDHSDATMLSGESANGAYPVEAVSFMHKTLEKTEASAYDDLDVKRYHKKFVSNDEAISQIVNILAGSIKAKAILVYTVTGQESRIISRYRPELPIYVACHDFRLQRQLQLSWGLEPMVIPMCQNIDEFLEIAIEKLKIEKQLKKNDKVIVIANQPLNEVGDMNFVEIKTVE